MYWEVFFMYTQNKILFLYQGLYYLHSFNYFVIYGNWVVFLDLLLSLVTLRPVNLREQFHRKPLSLYSEVCEIMYCAYVKNDDQRMSQFEHSMTAHLSWHLQNYDMIWPLQLKLAPKNCHKISIISS